MFSTTLRHVREPGVYPREEIIRPERLDNKVRSAHANVAFAHWTRATLDAIGKGGFGYDLGALDRTQEGQLANYEVCILSLRTI